MNNNENNSNNFGNSELINNENLSQVDKNIQKQFEINNNKSVKKYLILIAIAITILLGIGIIWYFNYYTKPKSIVSRIVNATYEKYLNLENNSLLDNLNFDYKTNTIKANGDISFSLNVSSDTNNEIDLTTILNNLSKTTYNYEGIINLASKQLSLNLKAKEDNKEILSFNTFYQNKKFYLKSEGITNYPYYYEIEDDSIFDSLLESGLLDLTKEDINYLINHYTNYFNSSLKEEYFEQEFGKFTVENVEILGYKTTFNCTQKNLVEIYKSIINLLLKDEKSLDIMSKISSLTTSETIENLNEILEELNGMEDSDYDIEDAIKISIYTDIIGNLKALIFLKIEDYNIETDRIVGVKEDDVITIKDYNNEISTFPNFDTITINLKTKELNLITNESNLKFVLNDKGIKAVYNQEYTEYNYYKKTISTNVSIDYSNVFENNISNSKTDISFNYANDDSKINGTLNHTSSLSITDDISRFDVTNAKNIENITQEELKLIYNNLMNKISGSNLGNLVNSYILLFVNPLVNTMESVKQTAFLTQANSLKDAAANAVSLIEIGNITSGYKQISSVTNSSTNNYCFTVTDLENYGFYKNSQGIIGYVIAKEDTNGDYKYYIALTNDEYSINQTKAGSKSSDLTKDAPDYNIKNSCDDVNISTINSLY